MKGRTRLQTRMFCDPLAGLKAEFMLHTQYKVWRLEAQALKVLWMGDELIDDLRASLVAQWLRICLLMQGTRVRALAWEDPTCRRAAGPVSHNC